MNSLLAWFIRNPVAANLLMLLLLVAGYFTVTGIRIEGFPALPPNSLSISIVYPGASVEQVDRGVTRLVERALEGLPGVKKIAATSGEGYCLVWVQKDTGIDFDRFQDDIKTRLDSMPNLPRLAERPVISRDELTMPAILVQIYGETDEETLQEIARLVRNELLADPQISKLEVFGLQTAEVRIEVDNDRLSAHGLSVVELEQAIARSSVEYQTGTLKSSAAIIQLRADQEALYYTDFNNLPVKTLPNGTRLLLKDVARVSDGFAEADLVARFQGQPCVGILIFTGKKGDLLQVSKVAQRIVEKLQPQIPAVVQVEPWIDFSIYMQDRLSLLQTNGWQGLLIVFVLLALFLNYKLAFWVAMGIPISLAGALALMGERFLDYSLNDITSFGLIIVLGILVDDAIIVGEAVFAERSCSTDPITATIKGVERVAMATVFGCFTTVAAFYPLLLIDNELGKIFASFSVVVIVALLFSLLESKLILPAHLASLSMKSKPPSNLWHKSWVGLQRGAARCLNCINLQIYQPVLVRALKHRYSALILFITVAVMGCMVFTGQLRTLFFPEVPGDIITVNLEMENGSPQSLTTANLASIEMAASELNAELMAQLSLAAPPIRRVMTALTDTGSGEIYAELQPEKTRAMPTLETLRKWRDKVGRLEGVEELEFSGSLETGGGFMVEVAARDETVLLNAVRELRAALQQIKGVADVRDDLQGEMPELRLRLKPVAEHLGLTAADLARQIGDGFGGLEIQRLQRGTEEVRAVIRYQQQQRQYLSDLYSSRIRTEDGRWLPLLAVADIETGYSQGEIRRQNGRRAVQVRASLEKEQIGTEELYVRMQETLVPDLKRKYPGVTIGGVGELEEIGEMKTGLKKGLVMILVLIFALLAIPLKSYWQPLVIMSVIPFGFAGAVIGHKIAGIPLSVLSFFGMLALAGVVVNDSLVMLTRYNQLRCEGVPQAPALLQAGTSRFRAILLTTVTTVSGLAPMLLETSEQAQYLIPAAVSLAYGELFATPLTLVLVPLLICIGEDVKGLLSGMKKWLLRSGQVESDASM